MNKNLSLAIEKAVGKINPRDNFEINSEFDNQLSYAINLLTV